MAIESFGAESVYRPGHSSEQIVRIEAEKHLRKKYTPDLSIELCQKD